MKKLKMSPALLLITWFGSGLLRPASGTWGTLAAMPFAWGIHAYFGNIGLIVAAILLYVISIPCLTWYEKTTQTHDSSRIVIDEVIGIFLTLSVAALHPIDYVAGFFLFRTFDALKPNIVGFIDQKVKGVHGVLLDDIAAGLGAAGCLIILHLVSQ